jgi:hypothetical protein
MDVGLGAIIVKVWVATHMVHGRIFTVGAQHTIVGDVNLGMRVERGTILVGLILIGVELAREESWTLAPNMLGIDPLRLDHGMDAGEIATKEWRILEVRTRHGDESATGWGAKDARGISVASEAEADRGDRWHDVSEREFEGGSGPDFATDATTGEGLAVIRVRDGGNTAFLALAAGARIFGGTISLLARELDVGFAIDFVDWLRESDHGPRSPRATSASRGAVGTTSRWPHSSRRGGGVITSTACHLVVSVEGTVPCIWSDNFETLVGVGLGNTGAIVGHCDTVLLMAALCAPGTTVAVTASLSGAGLNGLHLVILDKRHIGGADGRRCELDVVANTDLGRDNVAAGPKIRGACVAVEGPTEGGAPCTRWASVLFPVRRSAVNLSGRHIRRRCGFGGGSLCGRVETREAAHGTAIVAETGTIQSDHGSTLLRPIHRGERLKERNSVP